MPLSWNDIRDRAMKFSLDWENAESEDADAKSFWDGFFEVFGVSRRRVATFEHRIKKIDGKDGYIDLLWKGILLVEHKSRGRDLDRAYSQAKDYFPGLKDRDLPRYILVSDFEKFRLFDLEDGTQTQFPLKDLHKNIGLFGFIAGYQTTKFKEEDHVNVKAAERMGKLHDKLKAIGYEGHPLEVYLVRLLFCLFGEDAGVFERRQFQDFIEQRTSEDGADLAARMAELFQVLNTLESKRMGGTDDQLKAFRYVNGQLFSEHLPIAAFDRDMRDILLECCALDWSRISPAIFGAMFQSIMDAKLRRNLGAHYTSEKNIMKVIGPLFLDDLHAEFETCKTSTKKLEDFHKKIASLKFLDPACGCGNFLIISYRELRELELKILHILLPKKYGQQKILDIAPEILCNVDQFYGIEIEEFPAQIAQTALWLMDHQMNMRIGAEFGQYFSRLPLKSSATIVNANALRIDWRDVIKPSALNYILGNPPFIGNAYQTAGQKIDMDNIFNNIKSAGMLDFVTAWYIKASDIMSENPIIKTAFVSTNSIVQGEQVGILWGELLKRGAKIYFAHRTFQWNNEARGNAAVHCVIIGFALHEIPIRRLFDYSSLTSEPQETHASIINSYLVDAPEVIINSVMQPISFNVPKMLSGSAARDGGFLICSDEEKNEIVLKEPATEKFFKRLISGDDFINGIIRWCIWLKNTPSHEFSNIKEFRNRFEKVRIFRESSSRDGTKKMAALPYLFAEERQPKDNFLLIPKVSSENRAYVPIAYLSKDFIVTDKTFYVPNASCYQFGIITSAMHMAWMRYVGGRLKSDYSYSNTIVYNNFPWPQEITDKQKQSIETAAQNVLDSRTAHPGASLADLYDPNTMPPDLVKAHRALDAAVDAAYSKKKFTGDSDRVAFLFELYQKLAAPLDATTAKKPKKPRKSPKK